MPNICGIFDFNAKKLSARETFLHDTNKSLEIASDAVLTNRTELFTKFGVLPFEQKDFNDEHLILKAYEKWGEECPNYLVGNFAFAIWDKQNRKLFCCRDHFGASTLFYFKDKNKFIFASEPRDVIRLGKIEKQFNRDKLITFLLPEPHIFLNNQSWFENILPFPSGTSFTIDENHIKTKRYWKPQRKETFVNRKDDEILEEFRELFFEIIDARLKNNPNPISLLSGGLDSSSIVSVMAKILEKQNKDFDVFAGVLEDENDENFSDERFYIDQFKDYPNVIINYVSAPKLGPFSNLESFFENYDSPQITSRHYLYREFQRKAEEKKANLLYDGSIGEAGATFHGTGGFAEMFANFKWKQLWRELKLRNKLYGDSIKYNLRANTVNPILPKFLIHLKKGKINHKTLLNNNHFLQKDFAQNLLESLDYEKALPKGTSPNTQINQLNEIAFLQKKIAEIPSTKFGHNSVEIRYPFLDKRLIEFTQSVPLHLKINNGYYRYLIRAALDGILPKKIQWRTTKTPFSPDYLRRYNSQIKNVKEMLSEISTNDPICEILDIERIKSCTNLSLDDGERYTKGEILAREQIPQAIYLIYFLRTFKEFRS